MKGVGHIPLGLAGCGVGLILAGGTILSCTANIGVKKELDPMALVQLGVTLLVGFFLSQYVTQRVAERKAEKEIVVSQAREALGSLRDVFDAFEDSNAKPEKEDAWRLVVRKFKRLSAQISTLED